MNRPVHGENNQFVINASIAMCENCFYSCMFFPEIPEEECFKCAHECRRCPPHPIHGWPLIDGDGWCGEYKKED